MQVMEVYVCSDNGGAFDWRHCEYQGHRAGSEEVPGVFGRMGEGMQFYLQRAEVHRSCLDIGGTGAQREGCKVWERQHGCLHCGGVRFDQGRAINHCTDKVDFWIKKCTLNMFGYLYPKSIMEP